MRERQCRGLPVAAPRRPAQVVRRDDVEVGARLPHVHPPAEQPDERLLRDVASRVLVPAEPVRVTDESAILGLAEGALRLAPLAHQRRRFGRHTL
jgi:hypothetical protein